MKYIDSVRQAIDGLKYMISQKEKEVKKITAIIEITTNPFIPIENKRQITREIVALQHATLTLITYLETLKKPNA